MVNKKTKTGPVSGRDTARRAESDVVRQIKSDYNKPGRLTGQKRHGRWTGR